MKVHGCKRPRNRLKNNPVQDPKTSHQNGLIWPQMTGLKDPQIHNYIHPDQLNTPRVITNQAQQVVWRWDNDDAFGGNVANSNPGGLGTFTFNLRFPGQYFDAETNNHYNYFRDYSPDIGKYIQSDPIGLTGGTNTYAYVDGNPVSFVDPTGPCWQAVWRGGNIMGWVPCGTPNTSPNSLPSSTSLPASTVAQTCPAPTPDPISGLLDPASIAIQPVCPDCWIIGGIAGGKLLAGAAGVSGTQFIGGVLTGAAILAGPTGGKNPMSILRPLLTQVQNVRQIKNAASAAKSATGAGSP